jgi:hypothetical protein
VGASIDVGSVTSRSLEITGLDDPATENSFIWPCSALGTQLTGQPDGRLAIRSLTDHVDVRFSFENAATAPSALDFELERGADGAMTAYCFPGMHR